VAIVLAILAGVLWGTSNFCGGWLSRRVPTALVVLFVQFGGLSLAAVFVAAAHESGWTATGALWSLMAATTSGIALSSLYRGLSAGVMGVVAPLSGLAPVVPLAVGLARGETLDGLQAAGIALAIAGIVLAGIEDPHKLRTPRFAAGAGLGLLAALGFGATFVALKYATAHSDPYWTVFNQRVAMLAFFLAIVVTRRVRARGNLRLLRYAPLFGLLDSGGAIAYAHASREGLVSVVAVLASLYPVVIVLLARAVLKERLTRPQQIGAIAALAGAGVLSV
jgi:drug/metabolite transporter (DMT)-like permease